MNSITHWLVGPQLIGLIMLAAGFFQKVYPPKNINTLYGYRTPLSMRNQQTWDLANSYSANLMIRLGFVATLIGVLLTLTQVVDMKHEYYMAIITLVVLFTIMVILMRSTEKKLNDTFDKEGNAIL